MRHGATLARSRVERLRIVLDTNVVVSALLWGGTPYSLLERTRRQPGLALITSTPLMEELAKVLRRPGASKRLHQIGRSADEVLADYAGSIGLVEPAEIVRVIAEDPDDDQVVATAVAAAADLLVSGDHHLLNLGTHLGVRIVSPADAVRLLGSY